MRIKIVKWVNHILENLKDDALQNRKIFKIIKNHILILSFLIILLGFSFLFYSNYESTTRNIISIHPNNDLLPSISSKIYIEYKEPVMRGDLIKVNKVCTNIIWWDVSENNSLNYSINEIWINLGGSEDSAIYGPTFHQTNLINHYRGGKQRIVLVDPRSCMRPAEEWTKYIEAIKEDSNGEYAFSYDMYTWDEDINSSNFSIDVWGEKAFLMYPIRGANPTEEKNIKINKLVLFFTGLLIIFASFPFCYSLKELLQK